METILHELDAGFPDLAQMLRVLVRVSVAILLGAVIGWQREQYRKPAGLRTHILVAMGSALFIIAALESGMGQDGVSRVIQGLAAGIGFIGAGAILKLDQNREIQGLTTAAGIWATAAVGVAVGLGLLALAILSATLIWFVLAVLGYLETRMKTAAEDIRET
jgi:putative Mg2+ transporter-C (MgtC) family protein